MACTCGKCAECDWARHHPDEDDALRSKPGETEDIAGVLGLTDSAEEPIRCGTFGEPAELGEKLRYVRELRAENVALKREVEQFRFGLRKIVALRKPHPKCRDAHEAVRLAAYYLGEPHNPQTAAHEEASKTSITNRSEGFPDAICPALPELPPRIDQIKYTMKRRKRNV